MSAWFGPGNTDFEPAPLPAARDGFAFASDGARLYVLGGWNAGYLATQATVYAYDPLTNAWATLTDLSAAIESYARAVVHGGYIYFVTTAGDFRRYSIAGGVTESLVASGVIGAHGLALIGDTIYHGLSTPTPRAYDLLTPGWSAAPGTSPIATAQQYAAIAEHGETVVIAGGQASGSTALTWRYTPSRAAWEALPNLPAAIVWPAATVYRNRWTLVGGEVGGVANANAYALLETGDGWETLTPTLATATAAPAVGTVFGRLFAAGGYGYVAADAVADHAMLGTALNELDASVDVVHSGIPLAEAFLPVSADIIGGTAAHADLTVILRGVKTAAADLIVTVDTTEAAVDPVGWTPPVPSAGTAETIATPGAMTPRVAMTLGAIDQYDFTHALGSGVIGGATAFGAAASPVAPADVPGIDDVGALSSAWARDADVSRSRAYESATRALLEATLLAELNPVDEALEAIEGGRPVVIGEPGARLHPLDAVLCEDTDYLTLCGPDGVRDTVKDVIDDELPTRREIVQAAATAAGVAVSIAAGTGAPGLDQKVGRDYRTEGRSALDVIAEMALAGGALHWFLPDALVIDGRPLPVAADGAPDVTAAGFWFDGGVASGDVSVIETTIEADPVEPLIADYLAECDPVTEGGGSTDLQGSTFETAFSGTLAWTERSGAGYEYREVANALTKAGGRVTEEVRTTHGWRRTPTGWQYTMLEQHRISHTYLRCCPEALAQSIETVYVAKSFDQAPGFSDGLSAQGEEAIAWWNLMPNWYLHSRRTVDQVWQAEGWLRTRVESGRVFDGFEFEDQTLDGGGQIRRVKTTYSDTGRSESNVPIGRGLWHQSVAVKDMVLTPIRQVRVGEGGALVSEIVGSNRTAAVNTYTLVTDQAPPTVSCGDANPCADEDGETCADQQTATWQEDHDAWQREVDLLNARRVMAPARKLVQSFAWNGHYPNVRVGARVVTSRGEGVVVRVSWNGSGPRTGTPGRSTSAEVWSALP